MIVIVMAETTLAKTDNDNDGNRQATIVMTGFYTGSITVLYV